MVVFLFKNLIQKDLFFLIKIFSKKFNEKNKIQDYYRTFQKIDSINQKFFDIIPNYINKDFANSKTTFSCSLSSCKKNYIKSPHIDRREHKFHILFYPQIEKNCGGELCLWKSSKKKIYDVFPDQRNLALKKKIQATPNTCLITLNTPDSYHSVGKYFGSIERKYLYVVYDFHIIVK